MAETSRQALKEWAAIERALAAGTLSLLVRKGGIRERQGDFDVEHRAFWVFPTGWHQHEAELDPAFRGLVQAAGPAPSPDRVRLGVFCRLEAAWRVERLEAAERLAGLHPLSADTVRARFHYRGRPYLHAMLVRAHVLPEPHVVPVTLDYEGCVSWVRLDEALPTAGARPALADDAFAALRREVEARLGADAVPL